MYKILVVQRISLSNNNLESRSIGARFLPFISNLHKDKKINFSIKFEKDIIKKDIIESDVVLFCKHTSDKGVEILEQANNFSKLTIYDLDDWIFDIPSYSLTSLTNSEISNANKMLTESKLVTVSNELIRNKVIKYNKNCFILGTGFDHILTNINPDNHVESKRPSIIYSNTDGVKLINKRKEFFSAIADFLSINKDVEMHFWGDRFRELNLFPRVVVHKFEPNLIYKKTLAKTGYWFGLVPLGGKEDNEELFFNSCKSPVKYIDYASLCIPGIYSNSPIYSSVIKNKITGLIVENTYDEWLAHMNLLLDKSELRNKIRCAAYHDAIENYSIDRVSERFMQIIWTANETLFD